MVDIIILTTGHGASMCAGIHGMAGVSDSVSGRVPFASPPDSAAGAEAGGVPYTLGHTAIREATERHTEQATGRVTGTEPAMLEHRDPLHTAGTGPTSTTARRTLTGIFKNSSFKTDRGLMWPRVSAIMSTRTETAMCSGAKTTAIGRSGKTANGHPRRDRAHKIEHKRRDNPHRDKDLAQRWKDSTNPVKEELYGRANSRAHNDPEQ
jgi:hypothetical protein